MKTKMCVCVRTTLLILFIHLITIHWFNIRRIVLPLLFDRLHKMFITRKLVFFLWPLKKIVVSQNRIIKTWSSLVSLQRRILTLFNVKFESRQLYQLCFDVLHAMNYLNQQRLTSHIIHNVWECDKKLFMSTPLIYQPRTLPFYGWSCLRIKILLFNMCRVGKEMANFCAFAIISSDLS